MKKVLLLIISIFAAQVVLAYQTVLIDFPENQGWHMVVYEKQGSEAILQYVPVGQDENNWTRTLIFHSYPNAMYTATGFINKTTTQMEALNSTQPYTFTKFTAMDSIAVRCTEKSTYGPKQCEIFRVSKSFEGLISMHYINKNTQDFKNNYDFWYNIVKKIRIYESYYRDNLIMDKATSFEL